MIFYIVLFCLCVCIAIFANKRQTKIAFIILWAVYAFRNNVGVDDGAYIRAFEYLNQGWNFDIEYSYILLATAANSVGLNYKIIFFVYATVSYFFLYKTINELFDSRISRVLYVVAFMGTIFVTSLSVMRQFLSACMCFYAVVIYYKSGKLKLPLALCAIATFFHTGAIIAVPSLLIFSKKVRIKYIHMFICLLCCILLGYANISGFLLNRVINLLPVSYQLYSDSFSGSFSSAGGSVSIALALMFLTQISISLKSGRIEQTSNLCIVLEKGQLLYLCLLFFFVHAGVASRLSFTFMPFIATLPYTFSQRVVREQRVIFAGLMIFVMFVLYILALQSVSAGTSGYFIPYNWSFDFKF